MPKIIKASEYVTIKNGNAFPSNNSSLKKPSEAKAAKPDPEEEHRAILNHAFQKAQQIMEAAQNYSANKVKESTERMNGEAALLMARSREEGYRKGFAEGRTKGSEQGYREGYQDGFQKAENDNKAVLDELSGMLETVEARKEEILQRFESDITRLSLAIAEKIIKKEISLDAKAIQSIIIKAIDSYRNQEWVRIYVSPNTKTLLADTTLIKDLQEVSDNVKIEASAEMKDGDCKIEMPNQMIDAGVDTQLNNIKNELQI
ncbi:FliH/SctL family protein [Caproiciproducens galactitolivorans]|uniref:FliH/SctL family protein n=1 Tax=Caproiciproducens galactitolivorans TaxID=642589 RepID=UPI0014385D69|nr:FliH/SctL family protein [Caproiciproducens galactitolivorans]